MSPISQVDSLLAKPQGDSKNTGVGSLSLLQWIFPTQESNRGLLHCRWILYQLSYHGRLEKETEICGAKRVLRQKGWEKISSRKKLEKIERVIHSTRNPNSNKAPTSVKGVNRLVRCSYLTDNNHNLKKIRLFTMNKQQVGHKPLDNM